MKKTIFPLISLLAATLIAAVLPTEAEAKIYDDTLRLHILAESDSDEDQALKLKVRDRVLREFGEEMSGAGSVSEAEARLAALLPEIERAAEDELRANGCDYTVKAEIGTEWYDTREYGGFSLPRGYYTSLRLVIGRGEGRNWWCVMYPPLCTGIATERAPADDGVIDYSKEELTLIGGRGYRVKFKLLEIVSDAFAKRG